MHISSVEGVDDMILLGDLKESAILHNLHMRYKKDNIYVKILFLNKLKPNRHFYLDLYWINFSCC
jgi:myosin heavy subunit